MKIGETHIKSLDHFRVEATIVGYNGSGGPWVSEKWFWHSGGLCREQTYSFSPEQWAEYCGEKKVV